MRSRKENNPKLASSTNHCIKALILSSSGSRAAAGYFMIQRASSALYQHLLHAHLRLGYISCHTSIFCIRAISRRAGFFLISCAAMSLSCFSSSFTDFLAFGPPLDFIVPACQLQIALGACSIHSRETMFKKLGLLMGPRVLVMPWLNTVYFIK